MPELERISATIPKELLRELDALLSHEKYASRSEALRDALVEFIAERKWRRRIAGTRRAVITLVYDHGVRGLTDRLLDIQHRAGALIVSTLHWHLDSRRCLEVLLVQGRAQRIAALAEQLERLRGVEQLKLVVLGR
jgi:CopG family nickel-responsive transcriptional regulator